VKAINAIIALFTTEIKIGSWKVPGQYVMFLPRFLGEYRGKVSACSGWVGANARQHQVLRRAYRVIDYWFRPI